MGIDDDVVVHQIPVEDFEIVSSKNSSCNHGEIDKILLPIGDKREWEEVRCPTCMDHPHNAVLLLCSSCDKGCRPYICDTSNLQSNCLDMFFNWNDRELHTEVIQKAAIGGGGMMQSSIITVEQILLRRNLSTTEWYHRSEMLCPFCRGEISGWIVIENARDYMNSKIRECSLEICKFSGNYTELMDHAKREHPNVKPSDADPKRQAEWTRMEFEREFRDLEELQFESIYSAPGFSTSLDDDDDDDDLESIYNYLNVQLDLYSGQENSATSGDGDGGDDDYDDYEGRTNDDWSDSGSKFETGRNLTDRRTGGRSFAERLVGRRRRLYSGKVTRTNSSHGSWNGNDTPLYHK